MAAELPAEVEYLPCGTIWVAADEEEIAECRRKAGDRAAAFARKCSTSGNWRRPSRTCAGARGRPAGARRFDGVSAVRGARTSWRSRGADAVPAAGGRDQRRGHHGCADGTLLAAGITVNATGAWAPELTPGIEVRRRKGHLAITDRYPGFVRHVLVELGYLKSAHSISTDSVAFNAQPRRTGQVLLGSSRQFGAEAHEIEARDARAACCARCEEYMPGLARAHDDPHLDRLPRGHAGQAAADRSDDVRSAPVPGDGARRPRHHDLARHRALVADQIVGRTPAIPIEPYLPGRKQEAH